MDVELVLLRYWMNPWTKVFIFSIKISYIYRTRNQVFLFMPHHRNFKMNWAFPSLKSQTKFFTFSRHLVKSWWFAWSPSFNLRPNKKFLHKITFASFVILSSVFNTNKIKAVTQPQLLPVDDMHYLAIIKQQHEFWMET